MKLGLATKLDKRNKTTPKKKKNDNDVILTKCDVIVIFLIYDQFGPDSGRLVYKTYILINSNLLSYKNRKQSQKIPNTAFTLLL